MKHLWVLFLAAFLLVPFEAAKTQDYETRINSLLSEVNASDIEHNLTRLVKETEARLLSAQVTSVAVLPFRDENNQRTGLTEYITAEIGKKLAGNSTLNVLQGEQVFSLLKDHINLAALGWTDDAANVAALLKVSSLIRGTVISNGEEILLTMEIYDTSKKQIIGTPQARLPRTPGLARLSALVVDEGPLTKAETPTPIPTPQQTPSPVEPPRFEPKPTPTAPSYTLQTAVEIAVRNLADKIVAHLEETKQVKVGVLEFLDLQGRITQLGKFMGEDLTTAIFDKGKFTMVERSLLQQVMREHALTQSGIIDLSQAQEIGKAVGADAIITGSLSDIGNEIKANARLIDVGSGTLLAVAGENIAKTENVARMFATILWTPSSVAVPTPPPSDVMPISSPIGYIYFEDFRNVPEGMLPQGWIGGEKLMVKSEGQQKFVTNFENEGLHRFTIDNLAFSENFELEYLFRFGNDAFGTHQMCSLGDVKITVDVYGWYLMNESKVEKRQDYRNKTVKVVLRKIGPLFKLFINGEEMLLGRYPQFKTPQALTFEFQNMNGFRLDSISLKAL